jgi:hypothetical protein
MSSTQFSGAYQGLAIRVRKLIEIKEKNDVDIKTGSWRIHSNWQEYSGSYSGPFFGCHKSWYHSAKRYQNSETRVIGNTTSVIP